MFGFLKGLFGEKVDIGELISKGATVIDVRTKAEYQSGHLKKSVNIPLDSLSANLKKIDKNKPVITCCASGARSGAAKSFLKSNGFVSVYNGGSWTSLRKFQK
jgi:phage shock protein E